LLAHQLKAAVAAQIALLRRAVTGLCLPRVLVGLHLRDDRRDLAAHRKRDPLTASGENLIDGPGVFAAGSVRLVLLAVLAVALPSEQIIAPANRVPHVRIAICKSFNSMAHGRS